MIERRGGTGFLFEAMKSFRIRAEGGRQHFDRDVSTEPRITGAVDLAHSARA
jgi:hypothetical protein